MLRKKELENKLIYNFILDNYVPEDHILRIIDRSIDFDFIWAKVSHLYSRIGQPAIDPVVLIKMLIIGYLFDIDSERQLVKDIQVNLAYRWFIKYDIDEKIPHHSTISQTRRRKFSHSTIFQDIFDNIVMQCIEKGLIDGSTIFTDSTHIKANASMDSLKKILITPKEFIDQLEKNSEESSEKETESSTEDKNDDETDKTDKKKKYSNLTHRSCSDPDSRLFTRKGKPKGLYYLEHRSGVEAGYTTDVFITPGNLQDCEVYIDRLKIQKEKFNFNILNGVADQGYGIGRIYEELTKMRINAYIPYRHKESKKEGMYSRHDFEYDEKKDIFICPAGETLSRSKNPSKDNCYKYNGKKSFCNDQCQFRKKCTTGKGVKGLSRSIYQDYVDIQLKKKRTKEWKRMLRKRKTLIEGLFGDAKSNHGLVRAKMRGIKKVQEQSFMTATVQNIKRMIKDIKRLEKIKENQLALIENKFNYQNSLIIFYNICFA